MALLPGLMPNTSAVGLSMERNMTRANKKTVLNKNGIIVVSVVSMILPPWSELSNISMMTNTSHRWLPWYRAILTYVLKIGIRACELWICKKSVVTFTYQQVPRSGSDPWLSNRNEFNLNLIRTVIIARLVPKKCFKFLLKNTNFR